MTTGKPEPSTYPYDPLPSTPQQPQPQYYIVLPFYSSSGHRRRRRLFRRYLYSAVTILLLSTALFLLWPSDPYLQVVNLHLDRLKVNTAPTLLHSWVAQACIDYADLTATMRRGDDEVRNRDERELQPGFGRSSLLWYN